MGCAAALSLHRASPELGAWGGQCHLASSKRSSCLPWKAQFTKVSAKELCLGTIIIFYRNINKSSFSRATFAICYGMLDFSLRNYWFFVAMEHRIEAGRMKP